MIYLERLSDHAIKTGIAPWDFKPATPIPEEVRFDKKERHLWINRPSTNHHVYSMFEGVNVNLRITKPKAEGEGNPPLFLHGLVADFDHATKEPAMLESASQLSTPPNWIERTLSGNWRFVWVFEKAIRLPSFSFATHFLKTFTEFGFDPALGGIGFDQPAWEAPERYWTNGCDWRILKSEFIPANVTEGWLAAAMAKFEFSQREFGASIPIESVIPALTEKYPTFAEWPGEFVVGAHGPTFWVPLSKSPMSATVYENGLRTFSENAHKTFFSWADLLGMDFVKKHQAESAGAAAADIYYDGKNYFRRFTDGAWRPEAEGTISRHLIVNRGVSAKTSKDMPISSLNSTLDFICNTNRVDVAVPAIFFPTGFNIIEGRRTLNTSTMRVMAPSADPGIWGPNGNFPWLSFFLEHIYTPEQGDVFQAWMKWAYKNAFIQAPKSGQVMFIAGPVEIGKTFLVTAVMAKVFGGSANAAPWLMGETSFNSELFNAGLWVLDDSNAITDIAGRRKFSAALKQIAASREFYFNEKFRSAGKAVWLGRAVVTMNADEESARMLPDLDLSNLDKTIILRTVGKKCWEFPGNLSEIIERELPFYCRWLLDTEIPAHLLSGGRFGIKPFADESLFEIAEQSSSSAGFREVMTIWHAEWFRDNPTAEFWHGSATELQIAIAMDPNRRGAMQAKTGDAVGRAMATLMHKGTPGIERGIAPNRGRGRYWKIHRDLNKVIVDTTTDSV
jgi:hypothetical protein